MRLIIKWDGRGNALIRVPGSKEWYILDELNIDFQQGTEELRDSSLPRDGSEGADQWRTLVPTGKKTLSLTGSWQQ